MYWLNFWCFGAAHALFT